MNPSLELAGPEAERLADAIEAAASRDLYAAAPHALRLRSVALGSATALLAPTLPVAYFNRVIGLGNETPATSADIDQVVSLFKDSAIGAYWVHIVPSARPADLAALLQQRGFSLPPRRSWAKFLRSPEVPPMPRSALRIRKAAASDAHAVAGVLCSAYGMPASTEPWFAALVGRPKWHVWVAEDNDRIVATGSLFVDADTAWLGAGGTLAEQRGKGAHNALIAARIAAAAELGCRVIATETGEPVQAEPNPSLANLRRAGFVQVCSRMNFQAPARTAA